MSKQTLATVLLPSALVFASVSACADDPIDTLHTASAGVVRINFQPSSVTVPDGYTEDVGYQFGQRNGLEYGWSRDISGWSPRVRNSKRSTDERHDTILFMIGRSWELARANGTYQVRIVAGDPNNTDLSIKINAEGKTAINKTTTSAARWLDVTVTVEVTDGRLTLEDLSGNNHARLCFVEVAAVGEILPPDVVPPEEPPPPVDPPPGNGTIRAIAPSDHPNLYFNRTEIARMRSRLNSDSVVRAAWASVEPARAEGQPAKITNSTLSDPLTWKQVYDLAQPLSKTNMRAAMSYMLKPTDGKARAMYDALLSWTKQLSSRWAGGAQRGGHMQYALAWMYDLLYNATYQEGADAGESVLSNDEKEDLDIFFQKYARILTKKPYGTTFVVKEEGETKSGYDNFYMLDQTAGLVFAFVGHDSALVRELLTSGVPSNYYGRSHSAFDNGDKRTFHNLLRGQVYLSGYTFDGYKRNYGFNTSAGFNGEDKGDGQHYHFFALLGCIPAAEAAAHNGFDAWSYQSNLLSKGFITGAAWAHTAYRVADPGDRNHTPLYWMVSRRYPGNATIQDVLNRPQSKAQYSYFFADIGPLWNLAR